MSTKVVTGKARFSYVHLAEPQTPQGGGTPKYSVTLLIPKADTTTVEKIKAALVEARENFCARNGANALPQKPVHTLYDGDGTRKNGDPFGPECAGCYVITVSNKDRPVIVDAFRNVITDPTEVYSGCYGRAAINFYGYSQSGNKGLSASLLSVQKLSDGEPLGGSRGSASDFDDGFVDPDGGLDDIL